MPEMMNGEMPKNETPDSAVVGVIEISCYENGTCSISNEPPEMEKMEESPMGESDKQASEPMMAANQKEAMQIVKDMMDQNMGGSAQQAFDEEVKGQMAKTGRSTQTMRQPMPKMMS